ncbi:MAG: hypothetical protein LDL37_15560 [Asticcacaulis sp.]|uniref:hypothetical protein n=1 Tax=Asticcacaulis sp. TaxID=1872648 RepID=UPI0025B87F98|nr:hypothetical protein [Asticcacaulis sp.]MCA1936861.1 hypothetical protein [Asticcacaulis sp.]
MAGRNQHHIPQAYQRAFGIATSGKPTHIWEYSKFDPPQPKEIEVSAAGHDFYSPPPVAGELTLDLKITAVEKEVLRRLATLSGLPIGSVAPAALAADVVSHLTPRSSHLREVLGHGMELLAQAVADVFGDQDNAFRLFGLDSDEPSDRFRNYVAEFLNDKRFASLGLPPHMLTRVAFYFCKENFNTALDTTPLIKEVTALPFRSNARDGHNKALAGLLENNVRRADLLQFAWSIEAAPPEGAILPDCVALGYDTEGVAQPYMMAGLSVNAVVMPLTKRRMLLGVRPGQAAPNLTQWNEEAAICSYSFFLAATKDLRLVNVASRIGERAGHMMDDALASATSEFRIPAPPPDSEPESPELHLDNATAARFTPPSKYQVSFLGCADQETAERIAAAINIVVSRLSTMIPLGRLEGITFAADYPAALAAVDRGVPGVGAPTTITKDLGTGVAMTVDVLRDETVKCRIVMASFIGEALIEPGHPDAAYALHAIVHQLAEVAVTEWFDTSCPGVLLAPYWTSQHEAQIFSNVFASLQGYIASRISAGFSEEDLAESYRDLLINAVQRAQVVILQERLRYRIHGDLRHFLDIAYPAVRYILSFAANLLGHCDGNNGQVLDKEGRLKAALDDAGLSAWLPTFQDDLQKCWRFRERWGSVNDLFLLNHHLERLLWQFGVFPWEDEQGRAMVTIPLQSDAAALRQLQMKTVFQALSHKTGQVFRQMLSSFHAVRNWADRSLNCLVKTPTNRS